MNSLASDSPSALLRWAQLIRLPNVFTVIADVAAAYLLIAQGPEPVGQMLLVIAAGIALYWAGMILNDVFDVERDRRERPTRPIAAGEISLGAASRAGWSLLLIGVGLGFLCGSLPGAVSIALAVMIVAYDGPLKSTPLAPAAMGSCRVLSSLLGAAAGLATQGEHAIPIYVIAIAIGFGIYIMGVTTMARNEATGGERFLLGVGLAVTATGIAVLALSPQWSEQPNDFFTDVERTFPIMVGLVGLPVAVRAIRAWVDPDPIHIQMTIRVGILSIIPLAASFAFLGAGPGWGLAIFALIVPSIVLAARFRVT